jgi:gliding motility-associated transport system ATP-binding protein
MIEVRDLTRRFGPKVAVDRLSFQVRPGEVLGFLGPNGAGKSTTMKMLTGFLRPSSGSAQVCGYDVEARPVEVQRRLGYLPEGAPLYADMTAAELLELAAGVRGYQGAERQRRVAAVVEQVHLGPVLHQSIDTLSKGFKRRVGLAQAILHDPEVLILDEPTDGLDPNQKHEVRELIRGMAASKVIVLSTHILEEVDAVCTRAIIIGEGRLLADETPQGLLARSRLHGAVTLELEDGGVDAATLGRLPGVARVETLEAANGAFRLYPAPGQELIPELNRAACAGGWRVRTLTLERGRLDEVFRTLTTTGTGRAAA